MKFFFRLKVFILVFQSRHMWKFVIVFTTSWVIFYFFFFCRNVPSLSLCTMFDCKTSLSYWPFQIIFLIKCLNVSSDINLHGKKFPREYLIQEKIIVYISMRGAKSVHHLLCCAKVSESNRLFPPKHIPLHQLIPIFC